MKYLPVLWLKYEAQQRKHHILFREGIALCSGKQGNYWCEKGEKAEGSPSLNRVLMQNVCATEIPCNSVAERIWIFSEECDS